MMEITDILFYLVIFLSALLPCLFIKRERKGVKQSASKLPPGSMGWPFIGETLQLYSQDPNVFFSKKQNRYGEIFKTHILGNPCVMLGSPEAARLVLQTHAQLFKPTYPKSKEKLIGPSALFFHQGDFHAHLRKLVQTSLSPDRIRKLIPSIESSTISALESWAASGMVINTFQEMKKLSFGVGILATFGELDGKYKEMMKENYSIVDKGYNSFPTNMPGTAYAKALQARKRLSQITSEIIREKKGERVRQENDLLFELINSKNEKGQTLSEEEIADNIIGVLFAAQDTTASVLTWILKYLHDHPNLFEDVQEEQNSIIETNNGGRRPLTWTHIKNMPVTYRVVLESLRMASIISFTFREAVVDVEYKGYLIPKGWKVMPLFRNIHHNPEFFTDPQAFDPARFEIAPKPNTFMPFGSGVHACPGNELAKLEILILLHHLVTKYRWEVVGLQSGIQYAPFPVPQQGLPARFFEKSIVPSSSPR